MDLDGGHLFLTVLAPVLAGDAPGPHGVPRSHRHLLAERLALLPTGQQTEASPGDAPASPFARNPLNHLARLVIIDDPAFNGREPGNTLVGAALNRDPLVPQPVDALPNPYLLFAAEVDAQGKTAAQALADYCAALWATMAAELTDIFGHCRGFTASAAGFHDYVRRCQVETTMPFNDYWPHDELTQAPSALRGPLIVAGVAAVAAIGAAIWAAVRHRPGIALLAVVALVLVVYLLYRIALAIGARPFPTAPGSDLPGVLKALFLQQAFTHFVTDQQGADAAALHAAFGRFLAAAQPAAPAPTQAPGVVAAPPLEG